MATSLQKQLALIASKSTLQLDLKAQSDLHSKSLLFEPKVAAKQDFDSLYQTCIEGFEELCALDYRFRSFADTLFAPQSKSQNRTQLSEQENGSIDTLVDSFLSLVSSRLLIKPAIKATEWLVRRFRAHEYNTTTIVLAFLPYHANKTVPIFTNLLSILPTTSLPASLKFLHPYIQSLSHPPSSAIVYTVSHDLSFFTVFNQFYLQLAKSKHQSQPLIAFWSSVVVQATYSILDQSLAGRTHDRDRRQEDATLRILNILNQAFALSLDPDMALACLMITSVFCSKADVSNEVVGGLMAAVTGTRNLQSQDEVVLCLTILAQCHDGFDIPKGLAKRWAAIPNFATILKQLASQTRVDRLVQCMTTSLIESRRPDVDQVSIVVECVAPHLDGDQVAQLLNNALGLLQTETPSISQRKFCSQLVVSIIQSRQTAESDLLAQLNLSLEKVEELCGSSIVFNKTVSSISVIPAALPSKEISPLSFQDRLAAIPAIAEPSFLAQFDISSYQPLKQLFEEASNDAANLEFFFQAPVFRKGADLSELLYVSFLIRIASSSTLTATLSSIEMLKLWLKGNTKPGARAQIVLPTFLSLLSSPSKVVRVAVVSGLTDVATCFSAGGAAEPWTCNEMYGRAVAEFSTVSTPDLLAFLSEAILARGESFCLDNNQVFVLMNEAFSYAPESKSKASKTRAAVLSSIYSFFASHAAATPLLDVRDAMLRLLVTTGAHKTKQRGTSPIIASIQEWASNPPAHIAQITAAQSFDPAQLNRAYFSTLSTTDMECMSFLHSVVKNINSLRADIAQAAVDRVVAAWTGLGISLKDSFASALIDVVHNKSKAVSNSSRLIATEALHTVELPPSCLLYLINALPQASDVKFEQPAGKRRRVSTTADVRADDETSGDMVDALALYDMSLSLIQKSAPSAEPKIMTALFQVLEELHRFSLRSGSNLVYLQGMALSCLLDTVKHLKEIDGFTVDVTLIRTDLLVDCVRNAANSQVLSNALLLISSLASWVPEIVLHGVMPIFTFIGNTILRQNDDFSAHVVNEALAHIVPPLVSSLQAKNEAVVSGVAELLMSFTTAFEHIPSHRRLSLFDKLVKTLGPYDCLYGIGLILAERYPTDDDVIQFFVSLLRKSSPDVVLVTLNQYVKAVLDVVNSRSGPAQMLVNMGDKSTSEVEKLVANWTSFLSAVVSNEQTQRRVARSFRRDETTTYSIHDQFSDFMQGLIELGRLCRSPAASRACKTAVSGAFRLLPPIHLVKAADIFLQDSSDAADLDTRLIFLRSLSTQVKTFKYLSHEKSAAFVSLLPRLSACLSTAGVAVKTSAIVCIDEIIRRFGKSQPDSITEIAEAMCGPSALRQTDDSIRAASLYCLGSIVEITKEQFIPVLPVVIPLVSQYLTAESESSSLLFVPVFSFLTSVCESIPFMFSGQYLDSSLRMVHQSTRLDLSPEALDSRRHFLEAVVANVEPSHCFAALTSSFGTALEVGPAAVTLHFKTLRMLLERTSSADMIKQSSSLFALLRQAFNIRAGLASAGAEIAKVESKVIDSTVAAVLKLNDGLFRPFFSSLVQWVQTPAPSTDVSISRAITLLKFSEAMFSRLQSLVTGYSSDLIDVAVDIFNNGTLDTAAGVELMATTCRAFQQSFEHDQTDFWQNPSNFEQIGAPLVQILSRPEATVNSLLEPLVEQTVIPAIVEFAVTTASPDHHKDLNSVLIRTMRSDNSHSRLAAVKCQRKLTDRLGEEWLALLPELLPIISELQEDDDEKVETETLKWIKMIEKILGESMDSMLR